MKNWLQESNERRKAEAALLHATPEHKERTQVYWVWADMISRCSNPNHRGYANYGGRGIRVCPEWRASFDVFLADMGPRPLGGMIDRSDNEKGYEPSNCRWASRKEQNSNRRNCIYVDLDGQKVTLREACRLKNITYRPIAKRVAKGWDAVTAMTVRLGYRRAA